MYAAAEQFPEQLPSRAEIAAERELLQKDKQGLEINQGVFVAHVLAHARAGFHLMHSMSQPTAEALALLADFQRDGSADLGPIRVDRDGEIGHVTIQNHAFLNSEDDVSTAALEVASISCCSTTASASACCAARPATHPKYAGRRIFGSGINLTHLYQGKISLVEFMLERELGQVSKMYRGHDLARVRLGRARAPPREAVDRGRRQLRDRRRPASGCSSWTTWSPRAGSYFVLPARKEGIIPGCANLRLPRFVGERLTRQAIFFNRTFPADSPEGRLIADEVVPAAEMDAAIRTAASEVVSAGTTSLDGNRHGAAPGAGAARPLPALHGELRRGAGALPLQPRADRQPRAQLERQEPLVRAVRINRGQARTLRA